MPKILLLFRVATLTALAALPVVALPTAPARAAASVADHLFPPSISLNGVLEALSIASADSLRFSPPNVLVDNALPAASSTSLRHTDYSVASIAEVTANSNAFTESPLGSPNPRDNFHVHPGIWNGGSWLATWTAPALPGFGVQLRSSGIVGSFANERLRSSAIGGNGHDPISEALGLSAPITYLPETRAWAQILAGILVMTAIVRRHLRKELPE